MGCNTYEIDGTIFIMEYTDVFRPIILNGYKTKYIIDRLGNVYNKKSEKRLKNILTSGGYYRVQISIKSKSISLSVHRLVALAFIPNPENKPDVNHKDGDKSHNYVENLEWATKSENVKHAFAHGLNSNAGEMNPKSKLTEKDVIKIWNDIRKGMNFTTIGNKYSVSKATISHIYNGDTWKDLYKKYHLINDKSKSIKYSDKTIKKAKNLIYKKKYTMKEISKITGININYLYALKSNRYRKDVKK